MYPQIKYQLDFSFSEACEGTALAGWSSPKIQPPSNFLQAAASCSVKQAQKLRMPSELAWHYQSLTFRHSFWKNYEFFYSF